MIPKRKFKLKNHRTTFKLETVRSPDPLVLKARESLLIHKFLSVPSLIYENIYSSRLWMDLSSHPTPELQGVRVPAYNRPK